MDKKIPTMKLVWGSVGLSIALVTAALIFTAVGAMWGIIFFAVAMLVVIDKIRKYIMDRYDIGTLRFFLLTMLPPIVPFGLFVAYYVYMENTHWAELEGMLECIILLAWAGVLAVAIGGTLIIAIIRKVLSIIANQKEKTKTVDEQNGL